MTAVEVIFWVSVGLLAYTHLGYPDPARAVGSPEQKHRAGSAGPDSKRCP